jgi:hypothetical protein
MAAVAAETISSRSPMNAPMLALVMLDRVAGRSRAVSHAA